SFPLRIETKRIAPGETNTWVIEIDGTESSIGFSTKLPKTLRFMEYEPGGRQAWQALDLGSPSAYSSITGAIFEFGFDDAIIQLEQTWRPLPGELTAFHPAGAVLAGDRSADLHGEREQLLGRVLRPGQLCCVVGVDHERRMEVAVSGVPPAAGRQPVPRADLERPLDGLGESVQRDDDVLADLAAALRRHRDRHALAPAPERGYLYRRGRHVERLGAVGERLTELGLEPTRLA